jgi:hypothetical protein
MSTVLTSLLFYFNLALAWLLGLIAWPFELVSAWLALFVISALAGVGLLWLFGRVSAQDKIRAVKKQIMASVIESVLFRHDIALCLRAQWRMLLLGLQYFARAVPPLLILAVPCLVLLAHLNLRYGYHGLNPGTSALLTVKVRDPNSLETLSLEGTATGLELIGPVRIPEQREAVFRLDSKTVGISEFQLKLDNARVASLTIPVQSQVVNGNKYSFQLASSALGMLLYPSSQQLPAAIESVFLELPEQDYSLLGFQLHWAIFFFVISLLAGLVASKRLGVAI